MYKPGETFKAYLQCLLALELLVQRGLQELAVRQLASYFAGILQAPDPSIIVPGRPGKEYTRFLAELKEERVPLNLEAWPALDVAPLLLCLAGLQRMPAIAT